MTHSGTSTRQNTALTKPRVMISREITVKKSKSEAGRQASRAGKQTGESSTEVSRHSGQTAVFLEGYIWSDSRG